MKSTNKLVLVLFVTLVLSASHLGACEPDSVISVSTVEQLYAAINNPANADAAIHLAPGDYVLSPTNSQGGNRPHGGTLRLLPGMCLVGSERRVHLNPNGVPDPVSAATPNDFAVPGTETNIDGSQLEVQFKVRKDCEGRALNVPEPMIAISRENSISFLHIFGADVSIGEPANLPGSDRNLSVNIQDSVIEGGFAVAIANFGCNSTPVRSVLNFTGNVVRNSGTGLGIANVLNGKAGDITSNGPQIMANVTSNLFYNLETGMRVQGGSRGTDGALTTLEMRNNVFRNNAANLVAFAGAGRENGGLTIGNRLHVKSHSDTFGQSKNDPSVYLIGSRFDDILSEPQHCVLEAEFIGTHFVRDRAARKNAPEISIIGGEAGGSDNEAIVLIRRAIVTTSAGAAISGVLLIQNESGSGTAPNTARLMGSRETFLQSNQGFPAPSDSFFIRK